MAANVTCSIDFRIDGEEVVAAVRLQRLAGIIEKPHSVVAAIREAIAEIGNGQSHVATRHIEPLDDLKAELSQAGGDQSCIVGGGFQSAAGIGGIADNERYPLLRRACGASHGRQEYQEGREYPAERNHRAIPTVS